MISESHINLVPLESSHDYTSQTLNSEEKTEESLYGDFLSCMNRRKVIRKKRADRPCSSAERAYKKTPQQVAFLEDQFRKDPSWSRKTVQFCKKALRLRTDQVYKWGFDRKTALDKEKKSGSDPLNNRELGLKIRREIYSHNDLDRYLEEVISGFDAEGRLVSLNELSLEVNSRVSNFVPSWYSPRLNPQKVWSGRTTLRDYKGYDDTAIIPSLNNPQGWPSTSDLAAFNFQKWNGVTRVEREANFNSNFNNELTYVPNPFSLDYQDPTTAMENFWEEKFEYFS